MQNLPDKLPDDLDSLKELVTQHASRNAQLTTENQQYKTQILSLQEQLNLALARRYATSSEKLSPDQLRFFTEAETDNDLLEDNRDDVINIPAHKRKKCGRKPLPKTLPRVDVIHDIPESERVCPHDGAVLQEMNKVISEQLDIIPAKIQVIRHIRKQYACSCGQCIKLAPLPAQPIPIEYGIPRLTGARHRIKIPGCVAVIPAGADITTYRRGVTSRHTGQLDDTGRPTDPACH